MYERFIWSKEMSEENVEMIYISNMIQAAQEQGLLTEVIWSFAQDLYKSGTRNEDYTDGVRKAVAFGLYEWDC